MAINVIVPYNGGFLPDIIMLTLPTYLCDHYRTLLNNVLLRSIIQCFCFVLFVSLHGD